MFASPGTNTCPGRDEITISCESTPRSIDRSGEGDDDFEGPLGPKGPTGPKDGVGDLSIHDGT